MDPLEAEEMKMREVLCMREREREEERRRRGVRQRDDDWSVYCSLLLSFEMMIGLFIAFFVVSLLLTFDNWSVYCSLLEA